jgi:hypothetical protein
MAIQVLVGLALMVLGLLSALLIAFGVLSVKAKNKALFVCYILTCAGLFIIIGHTWFTQIGIVRQ